MILIGIATLALPILSLNLNFKIDPNTGFQWIGDVNNILKISPLILSIEFIAIYYFRVVLKNFQSMSAQIVQLELRQSLCACIESYAKYKEQLGDGVSIEKFEEMIFSGIAMDPGQIPQTFDGIEKLASAVNSLKGKVQA